MKVNLRLSDDAPAFFMLGDPSRLSLLLSYQNPGPQEVDFSSLSPGDQRKVLGSLRMEHLESDVSYNDLFQEYQRLFSQETPAEPTPQQTHQQAVQKAVGVETIRAQLPQKHIDLQAQFQEKCKKLSKKTLKALKKELSQDNDMRLLRELRELEFAKRSPRKSILDFIELEIRRVNEEIIKSIENDDDPVLQRLQPLWKPSEITKLGNVYVTVCRFI